MDFDKFKAIYQFAARLNENSHGSAQFLRLTLDTADDNARDEFPEVLIKNLRRRDCVTQLGRNQFLILLNDLPHESIEFVQRRIVETWKLKRLGGEIIFEASESI